MGWDKLSSIVKPNVEKSKFWQIVLKFKKAKLEFFSELKGIKQRRNSIRKSRRGKRSLNPQQSKTFNSSEQDVAS